MPRGIITDANITGNLTANSAVFQRLQNQTADLVKYTDNGSTVVGGRNSNGQIFTGATQGYLIQVGGTPTATSGTGTTATITLTSASNLAVGDLIQVAGFTPAAYNTTGLARVTAVSNSAPFSVSYASTATGAMTVAGNVTAPSQATIISRSAGTVPLVVKGNGFNMDLQRWYKSDNGLAALINPYGTLQVYASANSFISDNRANHILRLVGATTQTNHALMVQNNSGTTLGGFNAVGQPFSGSTTPIVKAVGGATTAASGTGSTATITTTSSHNLAVGDRVTVAGITPAGYNGTYILSAVTANTISYANTTTGAQTVAGTVSVDAQSSMTIKSAGTTGKIIRAAASQAANLQEWQDSTTAVRASVGPTGNITTISGLTLSGANSPINLNGSLGSSGQVLTSSGAGTTPTWTTVSGGTFTGGTLTSDLILAAGSTTVEPIRFQTNTSTPVATSGALDYDGDKFYAVTSGTATGRLMVPAIARVFSNANATAATTNSSQSIFQAGARALTLEAAKTYYFRLNLGVNFTFSAVPAAIQLVPTFTQTPVAINYSAVWASGTSGGVQSFRTTSTSAVSISPTLSASITGGTILIEGFFQSNATTGGTVEFKYQISTGGGSSATAQTGTLLEIQKIGTGAPGIISGAWA